MLQMQEFIYSVVRHWKSLIIVFIVCALLGGGYYAAGHSKPKVETPDDNTETNSIIEEPAVVVRTDWEKADGYYVLKLNYVCVGNNAADSAIVLDAYKANLSGTQFLNHLKENYFTDEDTLVFISQIVKVDNAAMENCLTVKCLYYDEEEIGVIAEIIDTYIADLYDDMKPGLGDHKMLLVDSSVLEGYDEETEKWLESIKDYVKTEKKVIASVNFSQKDMVVNALLFGFVGLFAAAVWILISDCLGDKLYNNMQIKNGKIELLGDLSYYNLKCGIDKFFYRMLLNRNNFTAEGVARIAALKLNADQTYVLTGKIPSKKLEEIKDSFAKEGIKITCKELPGRDAEDIAQWNSENKVIFAARRFKENRRDVTEWIDTYSNIGLEMAGILFI